jgi:hypothetical protein
MSDVKTVVMKLTKSTKGTHVYGDETPNAPIPSVYIKKDALPGTPPQEIVLTFVPKE